MQTKDETNRQFVIFYGLGFNNLSVSLYSALKGYATLRIGENVEETGKIDIEPAVLRTIAKQLEYAADYIDESCPKDFL